MRRLRTLGWDRYQKKSWNKYQQHQLEGNGCEREGEGEKGELGLPVTIGLGTLNIFFGKRHQRRYGDSYQHKGEWGDVSLV